MKLKPLCWDTSLPNYLTTICMGVAFDVTPRERVWDVRMMALGTHTEIHQGFYSAEAAMDYAENVLLARVLNQYFDTAEGAGDVN